NQLSSGVIGTEFRYYYSFQRTDPPFQTSGIKAYSNSAFPISTSHGRDVSYTTVEEYVEGNGKEISYFTSSYDYPDEPGLRNNSYDIRLISQKSNNYKKGRLLKKEIFDSQNNLL